MENVKFTVSNLQDMETTGVQKVMGLEPMVIGDALQMFALTPELKEIAETKGFNCQMEKLAEECGELIQAALKYKNNPESFYARQNFIEEFADVTVLMPQLAYMTEIQEAVADVRKDKAVRTVREMREEGPQEAEVMEPNTLSIQLSNTQFEALKQFFKMATA